MKPETLRDNLKTVSDEIRTCCEKAGRDPDGLTLIAVSKTHPVDAIQALYDLGHRDFGENKMQELTHKQDMLPKDINWHFIGHLQSNKAKDAIAVAGLIHGVDSLKLLRRLNRLAEEAAMRQAVLLEMNISGETSKYGFNPDQLLEVFDEITSLTALNCQGLMTMAPYDADEAQRRDIFSQLRECRERFGGEENLPVLSMGMSRDFREAILEGASHVRIGTAIFGEREYAQAE